MATTISEIAELIEKQGWKCKIAEGQNYLRFGFATEKYVNLDGDTSVSLIAEVMDEGRSWQIFAPNAYKYEDGPHGIAVLKAFLYATRVSKFASWSLDIEDGEIQVSVRSILDDNPLTERAFMKSVDQIYWAVNQFHDMIMRARDTGEIQPPSEESPLEALVRRIGELSPAARDRVKDGLNVAISQAAEKADAPETL